MDTPPRPTLTDKAQADKAAREAREAAALRANLLKRKQQQRAREALDPPAPKQDECPAREVRPTSDGHSGPTGH